MLTDDEQYPRLYLGLKAVQSFKKEYVGDIKEVYTVEDVRDFVFCYYGIKVLPYPLVVEDLSRLSHAGISALLKFTEETKIQLIYLSAFDSVSSVFLSRMRRIYKEGEEVKSQFQSLSAGYSCLEDIPQDLHPFLRLKRVAEISPLLGVYEAHPRYRKTLKILKVLR